MDVTATTAPATRRPILGFVALGLVAFDIVLLPMLSAIPLAVGLFGRTGIPSYLADPGIELPIAVAATVCGAIAWRRGGPGVLVGAIATGAGCVVALPLLLAAIPPALSYL